MLDLRKRLQSLMPGEATKARLQDVLTVEWSGHKTVLVEVPSHNPKSNDVEMSGMSSPASGATGGYGRLIDEDDEDDRRPLSHSRYSDMGPSHTRERYRSNSTQETTLQDARPSHNPNFTKYHSYSDSSRPQNPFVEPAELEKERQRDRAHAGKAGDGRFVEWAGPGARASKQAEDPFR